MVSRQERDLAEQRAVEDRGRRLQQFRSTLLHELEGIRRLAGAGRSHPAVVLTAALRDGAVAMPYDADAQASEFRRALDGPGYGARIREAERLEFGERRLTEAAAECRRALAEAREPWQRTYATLLLARMEGKSGHADVSRRLYGEVLASPTELRDEYGVPFALYAVANAGRPEQATKILSGLMRDPTRLSSAALARMRELAGKLGAGSLIPDLDELLAQREQAEALRKDLSRYLAALQARDVEWVGYNGRTPWLAGLAGSVLVAVDARRLRATRTGRLVVQGKEGEPLGDDLPGLRGVVETQAAASGSGLSRVFLPVALLLVVGLTVVCGVLLWRDMQRSARLAEMRSHFISSVSHELRTPLTSIRMFAESMRLDDEMDAETRGECLDIVLHESERLSRLVDNVLHFARIEQGRAVYDLRPAAVSEIVGRTVRGFRQIAEQAGFHLNVELAPDLPAVVADRDAIEQALLNLLGNAMKYSGDSREILLRAERDGSDIALQVIDRGIGIPVAEQSRIFERFYRAAAVEGGPSPGAGLGLTLVDHIAQAHGGTITVESRPGEGSTFTLRLPAAATVPNPARPEAHA